MRLHYLRYVPNRREFRPINNNLIWKEKESEWSRKMLVIYSSYVDAERIVFSYVYRSYAFSGAIVRHPITEAGGGKKIYFRIYWLELLVKNLRSTVFKYIIFDKRSSKDEPIIRGHLKIEREKTTKKVLSKYAIMDDTLNTVNTFMLLP